MNPAEVREQLVDALHLDLIGPSAVLGTPDEVLPQAPSKWYLTGFLVPIEGGQAQRLADEASEELDSGGEPGGVDDGDTPEPAAARSSYLPSSIGMSLLVSQATTSLSVAVQWGDYRWQKPEEGKGAGVWQRTPRQQVLDLELPSAMKAPKEKDVPGSEGLRVSWLVRPVPTDGDADSLPAGTRSVSVFLVNRRKPAADEVRDEAYAFQTHLEVTSAEPLVARPNLRSLHSEDWDERVADLQYRDACEYAVGHSVATEAVL